MVRKERKNNFYKAQVSLYNGKKGSVVTAASPHACVVFVNFSTKISCGNSTHVSQVNKILTNRKSQIMNTL